MAGSCLSLSERSKRRHRTGGTLTRLDLPESSGAQWKDENLATTAQTAPVWFTIAYLNLFKSWDKRYRAEEQTSSRNVSRKGWCLLLPKGSSEPWSWRSTGSHFTRALRCLSAQARNWGSSCWAIPFEVGTSFLVCRWWLLSGSSYGRHTHTHTHIHVMKPWILLDQGPPSYDSFDVDWLLKSLSPNIATWGLELQQVNLGHNLVNSSLGPQMSWWLWDCWGQALLAAQSDWEDYMRTKHENVPGALTPGQPPSPKGSTHDWGWCRGQCQGARGSHWPGMRSPTSHEALVLVLSFFCQIGI